MKGYAEMGVYQKITEGLGKFVDSTRNFFVNTADEMKKSSWPTRDQLFESTVLVIVTLAVCTVYLMVVDQVLFKAIKYLTTF